MQAAPAVRVIIERFGMWNAAVGLAAALSVLVSTAWFATRTAGGPAWQPALVALSLGVALIGLWKAVQRRPLSLRWDTQAWYVARASDGSSERGPAQLRVMIDTGAWLLLKLSLATASGAGSHRWIPVQRHGIEAEWHALRCAVGASRRHRASSQAIDLRGRVD